MAKIDKEKFMPIYEYTCAKCGTEFEELVKSWEDTPECPVCHSRKASKKVSACASSLGGNDRTASATLICGSSRFR